MIAFINCRDRVTCLRTLVTWFEQQPGVHVVLIDNASTYRPLLAFYRSTRHAVVRLRQNVGHTALWSAGVLGRFVKPGERFVYTDPDVVPDGGCPSDVLQHLGEILDRHPGLPKVGLGLRIDDLPDSYCFKPNVIRWEKRFWERAIEPGLYDAPVDTTFALYSGRHNYDTDGARTGPPYLARHLPWYLDTANLDAEERYYREHARHDVTSWNRVELPPYLR